MKLFKSAFSKVHFVFMLFALVNAALGIALALSAPFYGIAAFLHMIAGILLITATLMPLLMKNGNMILRAFKARLFINKNDLKQKNPLVLLSKAVAMLMVLGFILQFISGLLYKTGLSALIFPDFSLIQIHAKFVYIMPPLLILHPITMKAASMHQAKAGKRKPPYQFANK